MGAQPDQKMDLLEMIKVLVNPRVRYIENDYVSDEDYVEEDNSMGEK